MPRRCRHKPCRTPIPTQSACQTLYEKAGFCGLDCMSQYGLEAGRKLLAKRKALEDKAHRARKKAFVANDRSHQTKLTQQAFNKMVRLLDASLGCVSCDKPSTWDGQWHASHRRSVGSMPAVRFDPRNCHKACSVCNNHLSGNQEAYAAGIVQRYGPELLAWIDGPHQAKKYTCDELIAMRAEFSAEVKRLEQGLPPSKDWRALPAEWQSEEKAA